MHKFNIKNIEKLDNPQRRKSMPPEETLEKFKIGDSGTFLDVGCGLGYFTIPAAKILKNGKAVGIDIMPEILEVARERAEGINNIELKKSGEYDFPIENESIDYLFISNVIHEIDDKVTYFNEIKRVLKKSGYLCIIDWEKREMDMGPPVTERTSKEEIKDLCSSLDFSFVEEVNINSYHYGLRFQLVR
jgi:ubiquinone/menaquinone biosynthesis C-methylase UbiE